MEPVLEGVIVILLLMLSEGVTDADTDGLAVLLLLGETVADTDGVLETDGELLGLVEALTVTERV
jgi:hypothetical protein